MNHSIHLGIWGLSRKERLTNHKPSNGEFTWRKELPAYEDLPRGVIIGVVDLVDCVTESKSPWFMGDYGFVLKNQRPIKPISCTGALGFWNLPPGIERKIKNLV